MFHALHSSTTVFVQHSHLTSVSLQVCDRSKGKKPLAVSMLSGCQQAVKVKEIFFAQTHFLESTNQITQKFPKIKTDESFRVAVKRLSRSCHEAVRWLSGKNHHNFEAKIKFGRWFRYHRRAYLAPSVLTPAKFNLYFRLSRGCSPFDSLV